MDKQAPRKIPTASAVLDDQSIVELVLRAEGTRLAVYKGGVVRFEKHVEIAPNVHLAPFSPSNNLIKSEAIVLASGPEEYGSQSDLLHAIKSFLRRYLDVSDTFEQTAAHYVLLTWVYDAFNELPYLRLRGDFGSGKTRALLAIGSLCYKAFFASGASTVSPIFHTLDAFQGTLVFDEADFRFSDERSEIVKILNNGNMRGLPVLRTMIDRQREFNPRAFRVFGPKLVATRSTYEDRGLESRFITEEMGPRQLRSDIPINLPDEFKSEALSLRNKLLHFRFQERFNVRLNLKLVDRSLEPRVNQILLPLISVSSDEDFRSSMRNVARDAQTALQAERGFSLEAQILEVLAQLAADWDQKPISVGSVAAAFASKHADEYVRPITSRWMGGALKRRFNMKTYKSQGVFVLPRSEEGKLAALCKRYDIEFPAKTRAEPKDVGTSETL